MQKLSEYAPPKVWKWEKENNKNRFSNINRPISGATSDKVLTQRRSPPFSSIHLAHPMVQKYTVMLEELLRSRTTPNAEYDAWLNKYYWKRDQFSHQDL